MGRLVELRRRPGAAAALHVLTVQRCAAAFVAILSYGALLWVMYSVWLRDVNPEEDVRPGPATLPVDYDTYRTSERARAELHSTASEETLGGEGYSARTASDVGLGDGGVDAVNYRTDARSGDALRSNGGFSTNVRSDDTFEDNLVEFENDGDEDAFEEEEDEAEEEEEEDTEPPPNRRLLVFNSVPHTGSEVITLLLRWLAAQNGFQYSQLRTQTTAEGPLNREEQVRDGVDQAQMCRPDMGIAGRERGRMGQRRERDKSEAWIYQFRSRGTGVAW